MSGTDEDGRRFRPNFLLELFTDPLDPGYADAAAARAAHGPKSRWRRAGARALLVVTLVIVGVLLAVAYRSAVAAEPERTRAHAGLVDEVKHAQEGSDALQEQADRLRRDVTAAQQAALGSDADELRRVREREAAAGLAAVTGPGAVVRLSDAQATIDPNTGRPNTAGINRVLDVDLRSVVNALWATGAEAVAINGQRLTATSTIRTAGDAILVDFRPVASPYEVAAIGPADLERTFNRSAVGTAMTDLVSRYGLGVQTRTELRLNLPSAPSAPLRYAEPANPPSPEPTR